MNWSMSCSSGTMKLLMGQSKKCIPMAIPWFRGSTLKCPIEKQIPTIKKVFQLTLLGKTTTIRKPPMLNVKRLWNVTEATSRGLCGLWLIIHASQKKYAMRYRNGEPVKMSTSVKTAGNSNFTCAKPVAWLVTTLWLSTTVRVLKQLKMLLEWQPTVWIHIKYNVTSMPMAMFKTKVMLKLMALSPTQSVTVALFLRKTSALTS